MYKAPKSIASHAGVQECVSGYDGGSESRHDVLLLPAWEFTSGAFAGGGCGFFDSTSEFKSAKPAKVSQ